MLCFSMQLLRPARPAYLAPVKVKCVWTSYDCRFMLIIVKTFWMFAYITTEYVSEVSLLCISYTCIVNFLSSLCCQTDYLFCYISINVILLLKTSCLALFFYKESIFFLALWTWGCRSCVTQPATPLVSSCLLHWRPTLSRDVGMTHLHQRCH